MNFTSDVKRELISQKREFTGGAAKAALSAFIRTSGQLGVVDGVPNFFIVSETENVAEFFSALFFETFGRHRLSALHIPRLPSPAESPDNFVQSD